MIKLISHHSCFVEKFFLKYRFLKNLQVVKQNPNLVLSFDYYQFLFLNFSYLESRKKNYLFRLTFTYFRFFSEKKFINKTKNYNFFTLVYLSSHKEKLRCLTKFFFNDIALLPSRILSTHLIVYKRFLFKRAVKKLNEKNKRIQKSVKLSLLTHKKQFKNQQLICNLLARVFFKLNYRFLKNRKTVKRKRFLFSKTEIKGLFIKQYKVKSIQKTNKKLQATVCADYLIKYSSSNLRTFFFKPKVKKKKKEKKRKNLKKRRRRRRLSRKKYSRLKSREAKTKKFKRRLKKKEHFSFIIFLLVFRDIRSLFRSQKYFFLSKNFLLYLKWKLAYLKYNRKLKKKLMTYKKISKKFQKKRKLRFPVKKIKLMHKPWFKSFPLLNQIEINFKTLSFVYLGYTHFKTTNSKIFFNLSLKKIFNRLTF